MRGKILNIEPLSLLTGALAALVGWSLLAGSLPRPWPAALALALGLALALVPCRSTGWPMPPAGRI